MPAMAAGPGSLAHPVPLSIERTIRSLAGSARQCSSALSLIACDAGQLEGSEPPLQGPISFPRDGLVPGERLWAFETARGLHSSTGIHKAAAAESSEAASDFPPLPEWSETDGAAFSPSSDNRVFGYPSEDRHQDTFRGRNDREGRGVHATKPAAAVDELAIASLGVSEEIVAALAKRGITHLFPIQRAVLEPAMKGRDLIARAKTGTGKTLAFGIPIIRHIVEENDQNRLVRHRVGRPPRSLVLAPTRELAKQVEREFMESAPMLSTICVYGGVSIILQQRQLQRGVDVAVGTPGRIIDLIDRGSLNLQDVRFLVLDEADQMLAVGFEEDVERILERLPQHRQGMLFSATMPAWVKKLARKYLRDPLLIDLVGDSDEKLAEGIKIHAISTVPAAKRAILHDLITVYGKGGKSIVFTQTKRDADEVALAMGRTVGCEALHGDISQNQREKTLDSFREGKISVLVATDVAARGLDVPNVDLVIHYEIPNDPETFVHRTGRTGRAGKKGTAILMYSDHQVQSMRLIEKDVGCKFEQIGAPGMSDVMLASTEQVTQMVKRVNPQLTQVFLPTAESLLDEQGPSAFAAALAHISGFSQLPPSRSLLTYEAGWTTLRLVRTQSDLVQPTSARLISGMLASIYKPAADKVGKISMIDDARVQGAVFDLPDDVAKELLSMPTDHSEFVIDVPKQLPKLERDEFATRGRSDMYGRFAPGGGGRSTGMRSSFDNRGGSRGVQFSDRSPSRSSDLETYGLLQSNRSDRRGDSSITCHVCNQPGHRASHCPTTRFQRRSWGNVE